MGVSFRQIRETCQLPVRQGNDVAGLLFGDYASLPITKLFVDLRLTPNIATVGMFVCGVLGAALQMGGSPGGAALAAVGAALLLLYYVLDCVDGEVARFQGVEDMRWGYYDYLFHMIVKPLCFVGVAVGCWRQLDAPWILLAGAAAAVAVLWLKIFLEIPGILFMHGVLSGAPGGNRAFRRFLQSLSRRTAAPDEAGAAPAVLPARAGFALRFDAVTLRALITNFDVGLLLLAAATLVDLRAGPWVVGAGGPGDAPGGIGSGGAAGAAGIAVTARVTWLVFYAVVLPLDFLDHVRTYLRRGYFASETQRLLVLAHHYRLEEAREAPPAPPAAP